MRVVIQRVKNARVDISRIGYSSAIGVGLLVLAAFVDEDTDADLEWTARKIAALRVFDDEDGVMNLSVKDAGGEILVVSQFTLYASTARGNRPSYIRAAGHETAVPLYEAFCRMLSEESDIEVCKGIFGADMQVELVNDGPVTIIIDSRLRE